MSCGNIRIGSQVNECANLPQGGTRARLILINYRDVYQITEDNGVITNIELYPDKYAYEFLGFRNDVKKSDEVIKTITRNNFKHSVSFVVYDRTQAQKNNIRGMSKGRFLAIVENKGKNSNSIEVLGKGVGLTIVEGSIRNAHENGGFFMINLATPENDAEFEKKLPQSLGYSYGEGLEIIDGILLPTDVLFWGNTVETMGDTTLTFND